jgi:hypothetical protein
MQDKIKFIITVNARKYCYYLLAKLTRWLIIIVKLTVVKETAFRRHVTACLRTSADLQMLFVAVIHLAEGLSLNTLLTLTVGKSLIFLVGTRRTTVTVTTKIT